MVPNLPYFMVQFDHKGEKGYGHVIEGVDNAQGEDAMEEGEKGGGEFPRFVTYRLARTIHRLTSVVAILQVKLLATFSS